MTTSPPPPPPPTPGAENIGRLSPAKVTLEHPDGTKETTELQPGGYIILTGPNRYIAGEQHYPKSGTVVVTIKRENG